MRRTLTLNLPPSASYRRLQHARHHAATGSMERDEVFVPKTRSQLGLKPESEVIAEKKAAAEAAGTPAEETLFEKLDELFEDAPIWNFIHVLAQQTLGWPLYLIRNASGQNYGRWTNHFDPASPIFDKRHFWQIIASDIGLGITIAALTIWGLNRGFAEVAKYYLLPYLVVNHHLVMITYLQHTDYENLPHCKLDSSSGKARGTTTCLTEVVLPVLTARPLGRVEFCPGRPLHYRPQHAWTHRSIRLPWNLRNTY